MRAAALLLLLPTLAVAQSLIPRPEDLGTVVGHITCADTQRPARNAAVSLVATKVQADPDHESWSYKAGTYGPIHTNLTGGYTIGGVPPGQYYLRVDLVGYSTPLSQFTTEDLNKPTPEIQQRIDRDLQRVTVTPNSTVQADATIRRAGSISGTVAYDDGSPAINIALKLLGPGPNGTFQMFQSLHTNGSGQFAVESLLPGEYLIEVTIEAEQLFPSTTMFMADRTIKYTLTPITLSTLPIYSGNVFRQKDAAPIKVNAGQETDDVSITIPLGKLHELSGTLVAKDGHTISSGVVDLLFPDTLEKFVSVGSGDGGFRFVYVPDGSYILRVTDAEDSITIEVPDSPDNGSGTHLDSKTVRTYATVEQPLTIRTDIQSLNLTVPDNPKTASNNSVGNN
jgi:hypothetical protein